MPRLTPLRTGNIWPAICLLAVCASGSTGETDQADIEYSVIAPLAPQSLLLDASSVSGLMAAVGEYGHVLLSRDRGESWRQALVPTRATLTAVYFHDDNLGWAVGHDAVILRTRDGGESWERLYYAPEEERPLLDVWFENAERGIAIGAYGFYLVTRDGGETWTETPFQARPLDEGGRDDDEFDEEAAWEGGVDYHLNQIRRSADGMLYVAAEAGHVYRSADNGETWTALAPPYEGSFFGVLPLMDGSVLVFGLRGNLFRSDNGGVSWQAIETSTHAQLTDALVLPDGKVLITGMAGVLLIGALEDEGFRLRQLADREGISTALIREDGTLILVGEFGLKKLAPSEYRPSGDP